MKLKIALIGSRGVPANYGGFETCAEQLGQRLAARGHDVTVYCRIPHITYPGDVYRGMRLVKLPTIANKYLDTIIHTFLSSLHALTQRYDVALYFIAGNSPMSWIPRLVGTRTLLHVDGLDWKREKWPGPAKRYIQLTERLATILPNAYMTDSQAVQSYYQTHFDSVPIYIPYGSELEKVLPGETLARYNLEPGRYVLFVGRLVEENCVHHLVEAFRTVQTDLKCVLVGDASYADQYIARLKELAAYDARFVFTGYVFGRDYQELGTNAYLFVEPSEVGGTHPALVEAMAFGKCVVVNGTAENREVIGPAGFAYDTQVGAKELTPLLQKLVDNPALVAEYGLLASRRASRLYTWDSVTDAFEHHFYQLVGKETGTT